MASHSVLRNALTAAQAKPGMTATTKRDAIIELIDILEDAGVLQERSEAERVVLERERRMSTGLENGIAIPHGKTDDVERLLVAVGTKPEGLDFDCADGKAARILILTLSPATGTGPHIRFMAEVSRLLQKPALRQNVLDATSPQALVDAFTRT